jgi:superfamily I DNA and RNA helicase
MSGGNAAEHVHSAEAEQLSAAHLILCRCVLTNATGRRVASSDVIQIHILHQPELDTVIRSLLTAQSRFLMSVGFGQPDSLSMRLLFGSGKTDLFLMKNGSCSCSV